MFRGKLSVFATCLNNQQMPLTSHSSESLYVCEIAAVNNSDGRSSFYITCSSFSDIEIITFYQY